MPKKTPAAPLRRRYGRRAQATTRSKTTQHIIHDSDVYDFIYFFVSLGLVNDLSTST